MIEKTCTGERKLRSVDGSDGRGVCQPKMRLKELKGKMKGENLREIYDIRRVSFFCKCMQNKYAIKTMIAEDCLKQQGNGFNPLISEEKQE